MSTTSKAKQDNQNLTRTRYLGRKPKQPSSVSSEDGSSDQKPEKPLPNYLKPTISSRPDPEKNKFLKKNNNLEDNQKLLRRRSFDRPPSSLTSPSSSASPRIQKSLNVSPSRPRDRPIVPRENKPVTAQRSSSFHGSRGLPRGGASVKSPHVAPKKSGLSSTSTSLKSEKGNASTKKVPEKEITLDTASLSSAHEDDQEEIVKAESVVQVCDEVEKPKDEKEDEEVQVDVVQANESNEEIENGGATKVASSAGEDCIAVNKEDEKEKEEEELINEDKTEEKTDETKEKDSNEDNKGDVDVKDEVTKKIDEDETQEKVNIDDVKEVESVEVTKVEKEEDVKEEKEMKEEEKEKENVKEEEKEKVKEEKAKEEDSREGKKREVVKGKKESPSAYNDVIASKMQENPRKNKVLALAGAFQTVIDYETAASK